MSHTERIAVTASGTQTERSALTAMHRLFRYPAKFHGPLARGLLQEFTQPGTRILDPFCGSGTLALEGILTNRQVDGSDVDPLATFIASAKVRPYDVQQLRSKYKAMADSLNAQRRTRPECEALQFDDISQESYNDEIRKLSIPSIPNLLHWFRRYVVVDLSRIHNILIEEAESSDVQFFLLCFASVIRLSSRADPVPVSGLEVTSHMLKRELKGRIIDPYQLFDQAVRRSLTALEKYQGTATYDIGLARATRVYNLDSTRELSALGTYDNVITSPPYHGAVDYYRRHTLEMYWLRLVETATQRLELRPNYIGRLGVARRDCSEDSINSSYAVALHERMTADDNVNRSKGLNKSAKERAASLRHYCQGMQRFFVQLAAVLPNKHSRAILVVGDSHWKDERIDTATLLAELATPYFRIVDKQSHHIKNRYMSYSRRNQASIDVEYVLVFERA